MKKLWKDLSEDEKIKIGKVWKAQAKRIRKEKPHYLIGENGPVPLSKVYDRLQEIAKSRPHYKIIGGPFEIIDTKTNKQL